MAKKFSLFFLIAAGYLWFVLAAITPTLPSASEPIVFYSNQTRDDLRLTLKKALKKASRSIHLTMYALTDEEILHTLRKKASEGLDIKIFYDPSAGHPHLPCATPIKGRGLMHRKITVLDDALVFLGSANMTSASLTLHDNLSIGLYHPGLAHFLKHDQGSFSFTLGNQTAEFFLLPTPEALPRLIDTLNHAKCSISIAMFTLTHPALVDALIAAHKRGISVTVALDFYSARGASLQAVSKLQAAHIPVFISHGIQLLHHKWADIDHSTLILGSANWTQSAFCRNRDCLLFLHSLTEKQQKYLNRLWKIVKQESMTIIPNVTENSARDKYEHAPYPLYREDCSTTEDFYPWSLFSRGKKTLTSIWK